MHVPLGVYCNDDVVNHRGGIRFSFHVRLNPSCHYTLSVNSAISNQFYVHDIKNITSQHKLTRHALDMRPNAQYARSLKVKTSFYKTFGCRQRVVGIL